MPHIFNIAPQPNPVSGVSLVLVGADLYPDLVRELSATLRLQATSEDLPLERRLSHFGPRMQTDHPLSPHRVIDEFAAALAGLPDGVKDDYQSLVARVVEVSMVLGDSNTVSVIDLETRTLKTLSELKAALSFVVLSERVIRPSGDSARG